jgi:signal peptidase I
MSTQPRIEDRTSIFIKRIVGLPGDRIEMEGNDVRVNGHSLSKGPADEPVPSELRGQRAFRERDDRGEHTVLWPANDAGMSSSPLPRNFVIPDGQLFVLGDNRGASVDSRRFGTVPVADVKGVARQVWFSASAHDGVRWDRLGKLLSP